MLENAIQFCERYAEDQECRKLAETYHRFADFWQNCYRSDWMLALLDATKYRNYMNVWRVFENISAEDDRKGGATETDLERGRENLYQRIKERVDEMTDHENKGYAIRGYARNAESSSALVWTAVAIREAVGTAMFHAGFDAGIEAGLQRKSREEASEASNAARRDAFNTTMSEQAKLFRDVLGNPYDGTHNEDFEAERP
jgi:hypothetical protein